MQTMERLCSKRLRSYKERTGLTNNQLAEKFDVGEQTISLWLHGKRNMDHWHLQWLLKFEAEYLAGPNSPLSPEARERFIQSYQMGATA